MGPGRSPAAPGLRPYPRWAPPLCPRWAPPLLPALGHRPLPAPGPPRVTRVAAPALAGAAARQGRVDRVADRAAGPGHDAAPVTAGRTPVRQSAVVFPAALSRRR